MSTDDGKTKLSTLKEAFSKKIKNLGVKQNKSTLQGKSSFTLFICMINLFTNLNIFFFIK
jgi:hypothetical protein